MEEEHGADKAPDQECSHVCGLVELTNVTGNDHERPRDKELVTETISTITRQRHYKQDLEQQHRHWVKL